MLRSLVLILLLAVPLQASPPKLVLPERVSGKPGAFVAILAQTEGKNVSWKSLDDGLNIFPVELLRDSKIMVVTAAYPGNYRLLAASAQGDEVSNLAVCTVVIEGPGPAPPVPPVPPAPDAFTQSVQVAFTADTEANKVAFAQQLSALYRQASTTVVNDASLKTTTDLLGVMQQARKLLMPDTALVGVRNAVAAELNKTLANPVALDDAKRSEVNKTFVRVATVLEGLK